MSFINDKKRARIIFKKFKMAFCFNDLANNLFDSLK